MEKMKRRIIILLVVFTSTVASAQVAWNIKVAGGYAMFTGGGNNGDLKGTMVGKVGIGLEIPLTRDLSFMPSLEFAMKGAKWSFSDYYGTQDETYSMSYIQLPILLGCRLNLSKSWNVNLKAGPYLAYGVKGKVNIEHDCSETHYREEGDMFSDLGMGRFDYGVDVGVDFENHRFVIGLDYQKGFSSLNYNDTSVTNQVIYASLGFKF